MTSGDSGRRRKGGARARNEEAAPTEAAPTEAAGSLRRKASRLLLLVLVLVFAQRLFHLGPSIDSPHAWRQLDTAHYARAMAEGELDPLRPRVAWMGDHELLVLECPLPQVPVALVYRWLGAESIPAARGVFLSYSFAALVALWLLTRSLWGSRVAGVAAVVAAASPLTLFYSRALLVDPAVLAVTWGGAWLLIRRRVGDWRVPGPGHCVTASAAWALAALVKAPLLATVLPLVAWVLVIEPLRSARPVARLNCLRLALTLLPPCLLFVGWRWWSGEINSAAPDWEFVPSYRKMVDNWGWYFGSLSQRLQPAAWSRLLSAVATRLVGPLSSLLLIWALFRWRGLCQQAARRLLAWAIGAVGFVGLFWNLNVVHDYYQLALVGVGALLVALALIDLSGRSREPVRADAALLLALLVTSVINIGIVERTDYRSIVHFEEGASRVRQATRPGDLVVVSWGGLDARSPHLLVPAQRRGWSVPDWGLEVGVTERLVEEGADWLAIFRREEPQQFTDRWGRPELIELTSAAENLFLYRMSPVSDSPSEAAPR